MGKANPDQWNEAWLNYGPDCMRSVERFLEKFKFLESVPKDARILDVGCGTGTLLRVLKQQGYTRLKGVEPEERLFERDDLGGILRKGDCLKLGAKKSERGRYDVAVMVGVLHHLKDYAAVQRCFRNIHAILRPGGSFYSLEPWKNIVRSIAQKLIRDTFVGNFILPKEKVLLKMEERELGQWLEMESQVTAFAPQAGLVPVFQAKDLRYRYIRFAKAPR